jgi:hypothetical protein
MEADHEVGIRVSIQRQRTNGVAHNGSLTDGMSTALLCGLGCTPHSVLPCCHCSRIISSESSELHVVVFKSAAHVMQAHAAAAAAAAASVFADSGI